MKLGDFYEFGFALTNTDATQQLYKPYWQLLVDQLGSMELEDITPGNISIAAKYEPHPCAAHHSPDALPDPALAATS